MIFLLQLLTHLPIIVDPTHSTGRLSLIEPMSCASMPRRQDPGNYTFFLDFEGSDKDDKVANVPAAMAKSTISLTFLGCYPKDKGLASR